VDGIAAVVENDAILMSDVQQLAMMQASRMGINPYQQPQQYMSTVRQLEPQALQSMIDQSIIKAKAEEDSVEVKDHEVEQALQQQVDNLVAQVGSEEALEKQFNMSIDDIKKEYREEVYNQLLVQRYQATKFTNISVSRREVEQFYNTYKDSIPELPKRVNLSQIFLKVKPSVSADSQAVRQLRDLKRRIQNGESFGKLASEYSEDPGSKAQGGDLGFVARGTLVPAFEQVAFSLEPGQLSPIVKTEFGYHLIQLVERRGEKIHVKHILISPRTSPQDDQAVIDTLNTIRQQILEGAPFDSLALKYSDDSDVSRNLGELGWIELPNFQIPEFRQVADTLQVGQISKPFQTDLGWHIVRLNDVKPGGKVTLDKNWAEIEQAVLQRKQAEKYQEWLKELRTEFYVSIKMDDLRTGS